MSAAATPVVARIGEIDLNGTANRIDFLTTKVLSHQSKLIAWAVHRHLAAITRHGMGDEFDQTFTGTAADAKWARLFLARIQQRLEYEDSRWVLTYYDVTHDASDQINITYEVCSRTDTIPAINNWIADLVRNSNEAETEIVALERAIAGDESALLRIILGERAEEDAEVAASGKTSD